MSVIAFTAFVVVPQYAHSIDDVNQAVFKRMLGWPYGFGHLPNNHLYQGAIGEANALAERSWAGMMSHNAISHGLPQAASVYVLVMAVNTTLRHRHASARDLRYGQKSWAGYAAPRVIRSSL